MDELCHFAGRPVAFLLHYVRRRGIAHAAILIAVLGAVACAVTTQYGVKRLIDALAGGGAVWAAFGLLVALIAADNFLWRVASWIASYTFVEVTGDLRRDLFRHLTGHAPAYFSERLPGMLTSRITATANAAFAIENMFMWNVLPPCVATLGAVVLVATVSLPIAIGLTVIGVALMVVMFKLAAAGKPLHHAFADHAAAVDGEMVDVIGTLPVVRAFGGIGRERRRFDATVGRELLARGRSLRYLEILRLVHAAVTVTLTIALLIFSIRLWQRGAASVGDVVLICTLGLSVLNATRDLAVALVDVTQHLARLSEALSTLLVPHELPDHPEARPLIRAGARVSLEKVSFHYANDRKILDNLDLHIQPGERVGLVGPSGSGKSTIFALLQRFYAVQEGRILIDGQDIARVKQESLRAAMAVVPQDVSLFHRSIIDNIRYGRPEACDREVMQAAAAANCDDFIDELPNGFETIVGDRGAKLSGGQRQRIAIARAFLKDAPILLLDEATSALDMESEAAIREALDHLMQNRTVVAIAHRLSTLRSFDRIVVLLNGRIVQDGTHEALMRRDGLYRSLIRRETARLVPYEPPRILGSGA